jgi:sigma-B regulation protein RsbU (phosphoserine phosphatase)
MFLLRLDPANRSFVYASAGHPAGLVLDPAGKIKARLPRTGIPLGLRPDTEYVATPEMRLDRGDIVLLLTDGIEECADPKDNLFGLEATLEVVRAQRHQPAQRIVEALYDAVRLFSRPAPQLDDVTAIIIKVL